MSITDTIDNTTLLPTTGSVNTAVLATTERKNNLPMPRGNVLSKLTEIMNWITVDGEISADLVKHIQKKFNVSYITALRYRKRALDLINHEAYDLPEEIAEKVFVNRLNECYKKSMKSNKIREAISATSEQAKILGLVKDKESNNVVSVRVNLTDSDGNAIKAPIDI